MEIQLPHGPSPYLAELKTYLGVSRGETGKLDHEVVIQELIPLEGCLIPRGKRFRAVGSILINQPQGSSHHQFVFSFHATSVAEAFAQFPAELQSAANVEISRLRAQQISAGIRN